MNADLLYSKSTRKSKQIRAAVYSHLDKSRCCPGTCQNDTATLKKEKIYLKMNRKRGREKPTLFWRSSSHTSGLCAPIMVVLVLTLILFLPFVMCSTHSAANTRKNNEDNNNFGRKKRSTTGKEKNSKVSLKKKKRARHKISTFMHE